MATTDLSQETGSSREGRRWRDASAAKALLRLSGEISTKSRRTRSSFLDRLAHNLEDALESGGLDARVSQRWSRVFVEAEGSDGETADALADVLGRVFGLSSFSLVEGECEARLPAIVELGRDLYHDRVRGHTYAVRARRSGEHDFSSYDVQRELGAALNPGAEVDLDDPEVTVRVEVRDDRAYLFSRRIRGAAGLPLGVQSRALALVSGGYDSAVAAWMTLRRGVRLDYVFCNLGGGAYERLTLEVLKVLADRWSYGTSPRVHVLDFNPLVAEMRERVRDSYLQVVLKRLMYGAAERVAREVGADALVTGESVGQVSSQTLANLRAIDDASSLPVLRPLLGFDKEEIMERARSIGTYQRSARVREYCAVVSDYPVTAADPGRAREEASALDPELLEAAVAGRKTLELRDLAPTDLVTSHLFVEEVGEDAVVLDVRDEDRFEAWHWPGASLREFAELSGRFEELDPEATYVLYCDRGTRSARLAERMQEAGYEAYSFRGGTKALRAHAGEAGGG